MKNTSTALLVNNPNTVNSLVNDELKENVIMMLDATTGINNDIWRYAIAVYHIVSDKLYCDDFKNLDGFATAVDSTKSTLSRYANAVQFMVDELQDYGITFDNFTYSKAYLLSTLKDELHAFMKANKKTDFTIISHRQLEELVKRWKDRNNNVVDNETGENDEIEIEDKKDFKIKAGVLYFRYRKHDYAVPIKELKPYIINEDVETA